MKPSYQLERELGSWERFHSFDRFINICIFSSLFFFHLFYEIVTLLQKRCLPVSVRDKVLINTLTIITWLPDFFEDALAL